MLKSKVFVGSLVGATALSAMILSSSAVSAEDYTKSALIRVEAACTLGGTVAIPHTDTISNGTYKSEIGETVLSAVCNDGGGFGIYAIGYTDDTDGNNVMKHDEDSTFDIATGIATSGNTSNWAMKLTAVENGTNTPTILNGYDSYKAVPSDYVKVASYPNATAENTNVSFLTYYATYVSLTQHSGVYTGKVKYVMVHPVTGEAPEKECPTFECAGAGLPEHTDPNDPTKSYHAMQDIQSICPKVKKPTVSATPPSVVLIDLRDDRLYHVAKLADGHCWMQDDLALDLTNTDVQIAMTTHDWTNASQTSLGYLFNGGGSLESKYATAPVTTFTTDSAAWDSEYQNSIYHKPYLSISQIDTYPGNPLSAEMGWKSGALYNDCAGHAGAYCYGGDSDNRPGDPAEVAIGAQGQNDDFDSIDILEDICPSGWRIPTSAYYYTDGSSYRDLYAHMSEYETLYRDYYRDINSFRGVMHFPQSGYFNYGGVMQDGQGSQILMSSSVYNKWSNFTLTYYTYNSGPDYFWNATAFSRDRGYSIRCIAKY